MVQAVQLSQLEQLALEGVIRLAGTHERDLPHNKNTKRQLERLEALVQIAPQIVEEFVNYLLLGKHYVRAGNDTWPLSYAEIELAITLLSQLGRKPDQIADNLAAALKTEPTSSGIIRKYSTSLSADNRLRLKGTYPQIHSFLWKQLPEVITPRVIIGAIDEVREWNTEYVLDPEHHFGNLKSYYDGLRSGKLREELIEDYLGERNTPLDFRSYKFDEKVQWLNSSMANIRQNRRVEHLADGVRQAVITPLQYVLTGFREELGMPPFEQEGYSGYGLKDPVGAVYDLERQVDNMQAFVSENFPQLLKDIGKEKEREFRKQTFLALSFQLNLIC